MAVQTLHSHKNLKQQGLLKICPKRLFEDSPVHSISMSVCFLFVPPDPESDFMEDPPDEEEEDDREEAGLSTASSRGPIFDCLCFLSLMTMISS